eukprot:1150046-Pelagomonas_calceolata.AAC.2
MLRGSLSGNSRLPAVAEAAHLLAQARGLWHHPLPINRHELMPYGVSPYPSTGTSLRLVASMDVSLHFGLHCSRLITQEASSRPIRKQHIHWRELVACGTCSHQDNRSVVRTLA